MLCMAVFYTVGEGQEDAAADLLRQAQAASLTEPGCVNYQVSQDVDNPRRFLLYEVYDDQAALDAHKETPHYLDVVAARVKPMVVDRQVVTLTAL